MSKDIKYGVDELSTILEERVYTVATEMSTAINVNNGILNTSVLEKAKRAFIMETVGMWGEELVKTKQGYPQHDISEVTFGIDCVILKRKDFEILKGYYEQLFEEGKENLVTKA
jgi:hypothetical protein|tara:strand:- start:23317 stop:23658 length:342 start_codon:yes stop_codon:yes gene_type:complete